MKKVEKSLLAKNADEANKERKHMNVILMMNDEFFLKWKEKFVLFFVNYLPQTTSLVLFSADHHHLYQTTVLVNVSVNHQSPYSS